MAAADTPVVDLPALHSFEEISKRYGISLRSMQDEARARRFEYIRIGHAWRMTTAQLEAFLAQKTRQPTPEADPLAGVRARRSRKQERSTPSQRRQRGAA